MRRKTGGRARIKKPGKVRRRRKTHRLDVDHFEHGLGAREFRYGGFGHLDAAPAVVRGLLDAEVGFHPFQEFGLQRAALCAREGIRWSARGWYSR